jgi:flagellar biosynthesis protein FlhF
MQFETFRGRDMAEAVAAVKAAFGPNALIASTRHVSNGRGGALGHSFVEVTAAAPLESPSRAQFSRDMQKDAQQKMPAGARRESLRRLPAAVANPFVAAEPAGTTKVAELEQELRAVRSMLEEMNASRRPKDRAFTMLQSAGIEGTLAADDVSGVNGRSAKTPAKLRGALRAQLAQRIPTTESPIDVAGRRLIACIGPTGVGKTTSLAKLAARAHLELERSVAVITLDTFRVGAVEQMRRFMDLIGLPFSVAHDKTSFTRALYTHRDADIILVDTASRAPSDREAMLQLSELLASCTDREVDVLLAVPATIRPCDVERFSSVYDTCTPTGLIVTKLDETDQVGGIVHAALRGPTPIAYLCDGPRVPEDLHVASADAVTDLVLPVDL